MSRETWEALADWWTAEVQDDPAYDGDVHPMLEELLEGTDGDTIDLGCGEGQGMRRAGGPIVGTDLSMSLLKRAKSTAPVVQAELPDLSWLRVATLERAFSVYLLDLIPDHQSFFEETARVVRPDGHLIVVINHPVFTAPGSAPLLDEDGQILWRWGTYFEPGSSTEPAGSGTVEFFHRPVAELLTSAARSGWELEQMIERGLSADTIARIPGYIGQEHVPRLAGFKWKRA